MAELKMDIEDISCLMDKLSQNGLGEICIEDGNFKLTIKAKTAASHGAVAPLQPVAATVQPLEVISGDAAVSTAVAVPAAAPIQGRVVQSPIVGTFYEAASADKPPFVKVGSKVKKGDILFVIESMKLMNEILSEQDGEVLEIMVENAQGVEYHQPIMRIV